MFRVLHIYIALIVSILSQPCQAQKTTVNFVRITTEQGLSDNQVNCIFHDKQGNVWIGTNNGLNKHNNGTFQVYKHSASDTNSIADNAVFAILQDALGFLWIGTDNGLDKFDLRKEVFNHYKHDPAERSSLISNSIRALHEDRFGIIWVGTKDNGIAAFYRESNIFVHYTEDSQNIGLDSNHIRVIVEDKRGNLWVGTDHGLHCFDRPSRTFKSFLHQPKNKESLPGNQVNDLYQDSRKRLWVSTNQGLACIPNPTPTGDMRFVNFLHNDSSSYSLSHNAVTAIGQDVQGTLWVGTESGGLNRVGMKSIDQFDSYRFVASKNDPDRKSSISSNTITCLHRDHNGNFWIGTDRGLNKFSLSVQAYKEVKGFFKNIANEVDKAMFPEEAAESQDSITHISGVFMYSKLNPGARVTIALLDANNNPLATTVTNEFGEFQFDSLDAQGEYLLLIAEKDAKLSNQAHINLNNTDGENVKRIIHSGKGYFSFTALSREEYGGMNLLEVEDQRLLSVNIYGQIYKKLPGDYSERMEVYIVNDQGEIIYTTNTDKQGNFEFKHLPPDQNYNFMLRGSDSDVIMMIMDQHGNMIEKIRKNEKSTFRYTRLQADGFMIELLDEEDVRIRIRSGDNFVITNIYYDYNQWDVNPVAQHELDKLITILQKNASIEVELHSHTDARGNDKYNLELSKKRANTAVDYIVAHNISADRLRGIGLGENSLVNSCANGKECTEEEHAHNRRTEFKIVKMN